MFRFRKFLSQDKIIRATALLPSLLSVQPDEAEEPDLNFFDRLLRPSVIDFGENVDDLIILIQVLLAPDLE